MATSFSISPPSSRGPSRSPSSSTRPLTWHKKLHSVLRKQLKFIGPGLVASVAYCDPGNWATDLESGSSFGYVHLFIILSASLMAILLQILATRLGFITGKDLAQHCRDRFYDRPRHKMLWRWGCLYPLYIICEAGIIFTDLAELLGTAIALKMLIPKLPLYAGVLLTSTDVFLVLAFFNSYPEVSAHNRRSMHLFEISVSVLVFVVLLSFVILLARVKPDWGDTFEGFLPSRAMVMNGGLYLAVSIVGATVMPHSLFLGSKVAIVDRLSTSADQDDKEHGADDAPRKPLATDETTRDACPSSHRLHSPRFVSCTSVSPDPRATSVKHSQMYLAHASFDIAISLFMLALPINASILIVASAAFFYGGAEGPTQVADLAAAYELLRTRVGVGSGYVFAIALLVAGQAASITVTLAGQIVSEGFLEWRTRPVVRRLVTRLIGIVPAAAVAGAVGPEGVDNLLVGSQVALSLVLPFVVAPLIVLTSDPKTMSLPVYEPVPCSPTSPKLGPALGEPRVRSADAERSAEDTVERACATHSFANHWLATAVAWAIFGGSCVANVYAIVQLAQGRS